MVDTSVYRIVSTNRVDHCSTVKEFRDKCEAEKYARNMLENGMSVEITKYDLLQNHCYT